MIELLGPMTLALIPVVVAGCEQARSGSCRENV